MPPPREIHFQGLDDGAAIDAADRLFGFVLNIDYYSVVICLRNSSRCARDSSMLNAHPCIVSSNNKFSFCARSGQCGFRRKNANFQLSNIAH